MLHITAQHRLPQVGNPDTLQWALINQLILELSKRGRTDDIVKAAADEEYQKKLLEEFDL